MPRPDGRAADRAAAGSTRPPGRHLLLGLRLQFVLRLFLTAFVAITLVFEPPHDKKWLCYLILGIYVAVVCCWTVWVLLPGHAGAGMNGPATFAVLSADVAMISVLAVLTAITSPSSWTSDLLTQGLFLIPLIAAAQLSPNVSAAMAVPTVLALLVSSWISKSPSTEPWLPIVLNVALLCGLACGSVALSLIQRSRVAMIEELAQQRTYLLDELLELEKDERSALSERLHDGALQCVLAARYDLREVRTGSAAAVDRVDEALTETAHMLRNVVRELHPEVLVRSGLRSAVEQLAVNMADRAKLTANLDVARWPLGIHTDLDDILYSAAREVMTNVAKHANARSMDVELALEDHLARLSVSDDGVGMSDTELSDKLAAGHIGLAAVRTKVLAADGEFDIRSTPDGTDVTISIPLERLV